MSVKHHLEPPLPSRPPEEDAGPMTWSYAQYEIKVFPFAFNPSFMVEDVIPEIGSNDSFGTDAEHVDYAQPPMDSTSDRTSSQHAELPLGAGRSSADIVIPPPPPPGNSGISFDALAAEQEDLRDARESLLGFRFRLRSKRRELKLAREKAGSKAGAALTLTRRYLQEQGIEFTDEMIAVFSEVDALRDELGMQEVNYEEVEAEFDSEEWKYTQQEEDVIETLSTFRPPSPILATHTASGGHEMSRLLPDTNQYLDSGQRHCRSADRGVEQNNKPATSYDVSTREDCITEKLPEVFRSSDAAQKDSERVTDKSGREYPQAQWLQTHERINKWLWETLSQSTFHRERLRDEHEWLQVVTRHWLPDGHQIFTFHTGDTTVSEPLTDLPGLVGATQQSRIIQSGSELTTPTLLDMTNSPDQEPSNLPSYPPTVVLEDVKISSSNTDRSDSPASRSRESDGSHAESTSVSPNKSGLFDKLEFYRERRRSGSEPLTRVASTFSFEASKSDSQVELSHWQHASDYMHGLLIPKSNPDERVDSLHPEMSLGMASSSPADDSNPQNRNFPERNFSTLFIEVTATKAIGSKVTGAESWCLPLVWLGLVAGPERPNEVPESELVPFVSISDAPARLPGPSQFF